VGKTVVILSAWILGSWSAEARACLCIPPGPPLEEMARSEAVFLGTVIDADGPYPVMVGADRFRESDRWFRLRVLASWKGAEAETVVVVTGAGGGDCGYDFRLGDTYLVYAGSRTHGDTLSTSHCSRTCPAVMAQEDSVALGPPRIDRLGGRAWVSCAPPVRCPVHPNFAVYRGHTEILFQVSPALAEQLAAAEPTRFPFAGLQVDHPQEDVGKAEFRGLNDALVCDLCRAKAQEWLCSHGQPCPDFAPPESAGTRRESSSARYEATYPMKRFAFFFDDGHELKFDSIENTLTRKFPARRDTVIHLALTEPELRRVYERMISIRFFDIPSRHPTYFIPGARDTVGKYALVSLFGRSDTTVNSLTWDAAYTTHRERMVPDWSNLYDLIGVIRSVLEARPEYAALFGKGN